MDGREARSPPGMTVEVRTGSLGSMTGVTIPDQKNTAQVAMVLMKPAQRPDVPSGVFVLETTGLHTAAVHDEKHRHVDGTMTDIFKLLLLDRAGNGAADRGAFQCLEIRHFIDTNDPKTLMHQSVGVSITPQNLLCALLEPGVRVRRFPVTSTMRL